MANQDSFDAVFFAVKQVVDLSGAAAGDTYNVFHSCFFQGLDDQFVGCGHNVSLELSAFSGQLSAFSPL